MACFMMHILSPTHSCGGTILQALQNVIANCLLLQLTLPKIKISVLEGFSGEQNAKF